MRRVALATWIGVVALFAAQATAQTGAGLQQSRKPQSSDEPFQSKFGKEWPALKDCLEYSEDSGDWGSGLVTYRFHPDGKFEAHYTREYLNRLARKRERKLTFLGTWLLVKREFRTPERLKFKLPANNRDQAYFLTLNFTESKVEPPFPPGTKPSPLFPMLSGGPLAKNKSVLVLDEFNKYPRPDRRKQGRSDPRYLNWIVVEDQISFFPDDTAIGKEAWTLFHR